MAKQRFHEVRLKQAATVTTATADGGFIELTAAEGRGGKAFTGKVTRGYRETPEERRSRREEGRQARVFISRKHKARGGRAGARREALRQAA